MDKLLLFKWQPVFEYLATFCAVFFSWSHVFMWEVWGLCPSFYANFKSENSAELFAQLKACLIYDIYPFFANHSRLFVMATDEHLPLCAVRLAANHSVIFCRFFYLYLASFPKDRLTPRWTKKGVTNYAQPVSYNMELYACNPVFYSGILTHHVFCPSRHSFLGFYKVGDCDHPLSKNRCKICDNNTFTAIENTIRRCLRCKSCERKYAVQRQNHLCDFSVFGQNWVFNSLFFCIL